MDYEQELEIGIQEQIENDERLKTFYETCEKDGEPDYELLRKHIEIWTQRHPKEMASLLQHRRETLSNNIKNTGATKTNALRHLMDIPRDLHHLLSILSPNYLGAREITAESRMKRIKKFVKKFPVFRMCEKL